MKSVCCDEWQVINTRRSLSLLYKSVPPVEVPFACLEINLLSKWTGHWQGDKAAWMFIFDLNEVFWEEAGVSQLGPDNKPNSLDHQHLFLPLNVNVLQFDLGK